MKYPNVIFYRHDIYNWIDDYLVEFQTKLEFTIHVSGNTNNLNKLFDPNFNLLITFGENKEQYFQEINKCLPERFIKNKWIHYNKLPEFDILNDEINKKYIRNVIDKRIKNRPIFSIFTTCFNSYHKILRAYNSIKNQTLKDWEWVIIDDSPDDNHFHFLRENFLCDSRIRLYRRGQNSGSIGNVKNEAVSLCRGKYLFELDHDDEIINDILKDANELFENNIDVGFIYMDFINVYENGNNFYFDDQSICKGYGSYYLQKYNGKWVYVYITPNINNITLSYLVCCPNHPRVWRKDLLLKIENFSEELPICDDYEILLRTSINTKIAKIHKLGYVQYINNNDNNFSFIRNEEINRIGPEYIGKLFYEKYNINNTMIEKNAYEDPFYIDNHSNIWSRPNYHHKYCNLIVNNDYDKQICIIGLDCFYKNLEKVRELYLNKRNDFILLDNKFSNEKLCEIIDILDIDRIKCYSLINYNTTEMINFFKLLYLSCHNYEIIKMENKIFNQRWDVINNYIKTNDKYLEIGIEFGATFFNINTDYKIGIDPDPKVENDQIIKINSDNFFFYNKEVFDIIFIDGMHQIEYVVNDINNSIRTISENGKIFIDDIFPNSYEEQLKIPTNHYYENGILKYKELWTGDVWKVIYFILIKYKNNIDFKCFFNDNYRGIIMLTLKNSFQISDYSIKEINDYDYNIDFQNYINLLLEDSSQI
jgi:glycosyltransferase involved in cell wall biosynthesis